MSDPWATLPYRRLGLDTPHKLSDAAPEDPRIAALPGLAARQSPWSGEV